MKKRVEFLKDDGTVKGGWIAFGVTLQWVAMKLVCVFWTQGAVNMAFLEPYYTSGSLGYVGIYFLKKIGQEFGNGSRLSTSHDLDNSYGDHLPAGDFGVDRDVCASGEEDQGV